MNLRLPLRAAGVSVCCLAIAACGVPDLGDSRGVKIVNDTGEAHAVGLCEDIRCRHLAPGAYMIKPGQWFDQNVEADSLTTFRVWPGANQSGTWDCRLLMTGSVVHSRYYLTHLAGCGAPQPLRSQ